MKLFFLTILCVIASAHVLGQAELDEIFDDGNEAKDVTFYVGTDVLTFWGGTPNLHAEIHLQERVGMQLGGGIIPFGYLADFGNMFFVFEPSTAIKRNISFGTYFNFTFKYIEATRLGNFKRYFYFDFKKWQYDLIGSDDPVYKRRKGNLGAGYLLTPFTKLGFDAHIGLLIGRDWREEEGVKKGSELISGFDVGITAFYRF